MSSNDTKHVQTELNEDEYERFLMTSPFQRRQRLTFARKTISSTSGTAATNRSRSPTIRPRNP